MRTLSTVAVLAILASSMNSVANSSSERIIESLRSSTSLLNSTDGDELLKITQQYLTDQVNSVTENRQANRHFGTNLLPTSRIAGTLLEQLHIEGPRIARFRKEFYGTNFERDWAKAEMIGPHVVSLGGAAAEMSVVEDAEVHYKVLRTSTRYTVNHKFTFLRADGVWKITADLHEGSFGPEPISYDREVLGRDTAAAMAGTSPALDPENVETPESIARRTSPITPHGKLKKIKPISYTTQGPAPGYNGEAAATYAEQWAMEFNPKYPVYGQDCTNFGSQALRAGGWKDDKPGNWYANPGSFPYEREDDGAALVSPAWREANTLFHYGLNVSHRFRQYPDGKDGVRGDIFFADWAHADGTYGFDGIIDHTMVVTKVGDGRDWRTVLVSYHSWNTRNLSMAEVFAKSRKDRDPNLLKFKFMRPSL